MNKNPEISGSFLYSFLLKGSFGIVRAGRMTNTISTFDNTTNQLRDLPAPWANLNEFAIVAKSNETIMCGGYENGHASASCYRFNATDNK